MPPSVNCQDTSGTIVIWTRTAIWTVGVTRTVLHVLPKSPSTVSETQLVNSGTSFDAIIVMKQIKSLTNKKVRTCLEITKFQFSKYRPSEAFTHMQASSSNAESVSTFKNILKSKLKLLRAFKRHQAHAKVSQQSNDLRRIS